jgi:F0F1-type ATP synthase assembly protein I
MTMPMVFWCLVVLFAVIGSLRGWAKELLVACSLILAMFINMLIDKYASSLMATLTVQEVFGVHAGVFCILAYFGYLTPRMPWIPGERLIRETLQDFLLGTLLGALNGILLAGSIWYFLHRAGYPFPGLEIARLSANSPDVKAMIQYMPPALLGEAWVLIAVAAAFVFVIVVFV